MSNIIILMYHRVCEKTEHSQCYFARGTAVEPKIFQLQLEWLAQHYQFISLTEAVDISIKKKKGNYCVLTFDDGYIEIKDFIWPLCKKLKIPITIFPIAGHTAESENPVYVDHYYAILHNAKKRKNITLKLANVNLQAPDIDSDIQWWVKGPFKEILHKELVKEQLALLKNLCEIIDSRISSNLSQKLYLSKRNIANLYKEGVEVGGHGYYHRRLAKANADELEFEITKSVEMLNEIGIFTPKLFCYPDGSYSDNVKKCLLKHGFSIACTVKKGAYTSDISAMELPRIFVRNNKNGLVQ